MIRRLLNFITDRARRRREAKREAARALARQYLRNRHHMELRLQLAEEVRGVASWQADMCRLDAVLVGLTSLTGCASPAETLYLIEPEWRDYNARTRALIAERERLLEADLALVGVMFEIQ